MGTGVNEISGVSGEVHYPVFRFELANGDGRKGTGEAPWSGIFRMKRRPRIFFVEDDPVLAKVLSWRLDKLGFAVCGSSADGTEAVGLIMEKKPDLVLLDIELGGHIDGIDVGKILCTKTEIPFIYLTSHTESRYLARAKETVPEGYIVKPFSAEQLRISIEMALRR